MPRIFALITGFVFLVSAPIWAASFPEKIEIPKEFASAQEYHHAGPKLVIFIQDIHASVKVQQDIAGLIEHLVEKYGLKSVAYEGNEGVIDTEKVFWFPDTKLKKAVSEKFLQKLELSGPEFARVNSKIPFQLSGMEDIKLYEKNLKLAKSALRVRQETLNVLKEIESLLVKSFETAGSKESRKLFELENQFRENRIGLADYMKGLVEIYPDPEFTALLQLNKKMQTIESREFFEKLESLRHKAERVRYTKSLERDLSRAMESMRILKDMVNLTATRDQYLRYSQNPGQFKENYFRNLIRQALSRKEAYAQYEDTLDDLVNVVTDFYSLAEARDHVMSDRLLKELSTQQAVIFVAGGFHTQGVTERLRKENVSYVLVQPNFEGRETLAEKIYFNSLAEVSNDIAAESVFSIPANKIPKKTEFNKDPEAAIQEVNQAVLAGAESGEFKVKPELLAEIAATNGKSLGSKADWTPVLKRSLLIQSPVQVTDKVRTIAMNEVRFARDLQDIEDKALLKFAAVFDAFNMFATMHKDRANWDQHIKSLNAQLSENEYFSFQAVLKKMSAQISATGGFKYDDEYARLLVNGFGEALRERPEYAEDIEILKAMNPTDLRDRVADIVRYARAKAGVQKIQNAALNSTLNKAFIEKEFSEEEFKNALILLAKNRDAALLEAVSNTDHDSSIERNWVEHVFVGIGYDLPQISLSPEDTVFAIFILRKGTGGRSRSIETLEDMAVNPDYSAPLRDKLKRTLELASRKMAEIAALPKPVYRHETESDMMDRRAWEKDQARGKWTTQDGNLFQEEVGGADSPKPAPAKKQDAKTVLEMLYFRMEIVESLAPIAVAKQIFEIYRKNPAAREYIVKYVLDAAAKSQKPARAEVKRIFQSLIAKASSLGNRDRTVLIQINSKDDVLRYSAEAKKFLAATEKTNVVFLVSKKYPKTDQNFVELRQKFKRRAEVVSNELQSRQNIADLNDYIFKRPPGDFALIAPYETLEKALPLDGLILLGAEDSKLKEQEVDKVPSALIDTALRVLAAGTKDGEFLSRTRGLDNGRIFMITSEYLSEWITHLFAEHSYAQQFASAA